MRAQVIAEKQVVAIKIAYGFDDVQVMGMPASHDTVQVTPLRKDGFVLRDIGISERGKQGEKGGGIGQMGNTDKDVYDRLGGQPRHRRAANVFDPANVPADGRQDRAPGAVKAGGPAWIIWNDLNRDDCGHTPIIHHLIVSCRLTIRLLNDRSG